MNGDIWQKLLQLETSDSVGLWHHKLFGRHLNQRRILEITSAARQAREFFRNAANSNSSVRPVLTFYGVASLSRALVLLFKPDMGETSLTPSHGLTTLEWQKKLLGKIPESLLGIEALEVQISSGLFFDLLQNTDNFICVHTRSSAVDWGISYDVPERGSTIRLGELLSKLPDVASYLPQDRARSTLPVGELTYSKENGFRASINASFELLKSWGWDEGFSVTGTSNMASLTCSAKTFGEKTPQFTHAYVDKIFGSIPSLHIAAPFQSEVRYSQVAITYIISYFLGMLARYFPTQWTALYSGSKGDVLWPSISAAQRYVETTFPELIIELINYQVTRKQTSEK